MISPENIKQWFDSQLAQWPLAAANHDALSHVSTRSVDLDGFRFTVQFNPARAISSGAKTDKASIASRPCFLCETNRPSEQTSIQVGEFEILVNPFPIFHHHYTIAHRRHRPQAIEGYWCHMAALASQLPEHTVFYNGPCCGASAPDHFHFQAVPTEALPLWQHVNQSIPGTTIPDNLPFGAISLVTDCFTTLSERASLIMKSLPHTEIEYEPKINALCRTVGNGLIQLIIIPRRAHRPDIYPGRMISPASIDLAGVIITPLQSDFDAMDSDLLHYVLNQVCYSPDEINQFLSPRP